MIKLKYIEADKLIKNFGLDFTLVSWILDFSSKTPQRVRVNGCMSEELTSSTGCPQGCVLSPSLFCIWTVGLLHANESSHGPVGDEFVLWCDDEYIQFSKTKDMSIDFRHQPTSS